MQNIEPSEIDQVNGGLTLAPNYPSYNPLRDPAWMARNNPPSMDDPLNR